jgi:hypothetical protein
MLQYSRKDIPCEGDVRYSETLRGLWQDLISTQQIRTAQSLDLASTLALRSCEGAEQGREDKDIMVERIYTQQRLMAEATGFGAQGPQPGGLVVYV